MCSKENQDHINDLKKTYQEMKKRGKIVRLLFLDSIVSYCEFLGFSYNETMIFLGVVRNCEPNIGQSWGEVENYDDIDIEFNKKIMDRKWKK